MVQISNIFTYFTVNLPFSSFLRRRARSTYLRVHCSKLPPQIIIACLVLESFREQSNLPNVVVLPSVVVLPNFFVLPSVVVLPSVFVLPSVVV